MFCSWSLESHNSAYITTVLYQFSPYLWLNQSTLISYLLMIIMSIKVCSINVVVVELIAIKRELKRDILLLGIELIGCQTVQREKTFFKYYWFWVQWYFIDPTENFAVHIHEQCNANANEDIILYVPIHCHLYKYVFGSRILLLRWWWKVAIESIANYFQRFL